MTRKDSELVELTHVLRSEFKLRRFDKLISRQIPYPHFPEKIIALIGMRRSGKSYFQYQWIAELLKTVPFERIFFLNFEDDRTFPFSGAELGRLIDLYYELNPALHKEHVYFFFDEIQNVDHWQKTIRRFYDTKNCQIILTGSSAKQLSKEIASELRGRALVQEIYPLNFGEWLHFKKAPEASLLSPDSKHLFQLDSFQRDTLKGHLMRYLQEGGFPEVTLIDPSKRIEILQTYADLTLLRDIVERHKIKNDQPLRYLIKYLLSNTGRLVSINKIYNDLKSQGIKIGKDSLYRYFDYLEDAFFIFTVPLFTPSLRKQETHLKKVYSIDNGLSRAFYLAHTENLGNSFENQIFLDLKRNGYSVFYYKTKSDHEIDFIAQKGGAKLKAFQVSLDPQAASEPKEIEARSELKNELEIDFPHFQNVHPHNYLDFIHSL